MGILSFVNIRVSKGISLVAPNRWACILPILEEGFYLSIYLGSISAWWIPFSTFCLGKATHTGSASYCSRSIFSGQLQGNFFGILKLKAPQQVIPTVQGIVKGHPRVTVSVRWSCGFSNQRQSWDFYDKCHSSLAELVKLTPMTVDFMVYIYIMISMISIVHGACKLCKPTYNCGAAPCMNMYESYSSWKPSAFSDLLNTDFGYKIPCFSGPRFRLLARKTK